MAKNPFTKIKVEPLLQAAEQLERDAHNNQEAPKHGTLRGGTAGAVGVDGDVYGSCDRVALLRFLGIDAPSGDDSSFYFNAGYQNEERWAKLLGPAGAGAKYLRENEVPTLGEVNHPSNGMVPITGRPDFVLVEWLTARGPEFEKQLQDLARQIDSAKTSEQALGLIYQSVTTRERLIRDGELELRLGIELKKVCSSYRAATVMWGMKPDTKHLVQAAHYSFRLGKLPWLLAYTSDSSYDAPYWAVKKFNCRDKIKPGRVMFYCGWRGDTFCFVHPESGQVIETTITGAGIEQFYERVVESEAEQDLGDRPTDRSPFSDDTDMDPCKYCSFKKSCDQYDADHNYDDWVDRARVISQEGKE